MINRSALTVVLFCISANAQWITGYYGTNNGVQSPANIPWSKYTHVIHFAAVPGVDGAGSGNGTVGLGWLSQSDINAFVSAAHANGKKALISIKDNDSYQSAFGQSTSPAVIPTFVNNIVAFVRNNGYDGVDLDWENNITVSQYNDLFTRLRQAMPAALITTAMNNGNNMPSVALASMSKIDQINIMCYDMDYQAINGGYSWFNDALLQAGSGYRTCDFTMNVFTNTGVPAAKLGVGMPYYVRVWQGVTQPLVYGKFSTSTSYYRTIATDSTRWQAQYRMYNSTYKANYLSIPSLNQFIPYVGPEQLQDTVAWARSKGYGGYMTFALEHEYLAGQTGDARYPLSAALYNAIGGGAVTTTNNPPVLSSGSPAGTLASGTTQTTMSVVSDESATCKYGTTGGTAYTAMPYVFSTTGGVSHSTPVTGLADGGSYSYYVRCADTAGLADTTDYPISFSVAQPSSAPAPAISISPNSGSGASQAFTVQLKDASGYANVKSADVVFGTAVGTANSCMIEWTAPNMVALKSDDNGSWSKATLGSNTVLQNAQCSVNAAASSVLGSGTTVTVNLAISFTTAYAGSKNIFGAATNTTSISAWQTLGSWTVPAPATTQNPPSPAVTPNAGTGTAQTFAVQVTDANGGSTVRGVDVVFGTAIGATNSCMVEWWTPNTLALRSDDAGSWIQTTLGSSQTLTNSQCSLSAAGTSVSASGNTLTVNFAMSFGLSYAGAKSIYAIASDNSGLDSGWQTLGAWTIPAIYSAPPTLSITPNNGSGMKDSFILHVNDSNGFGSIQGADVVFGNIGTANSCMVEWWTPNVLALKSDDNTTWLKTTLGSSQTLSNSQCSVNASKSSTSGSGTALDVTLKMSFSRKYQGAKTISAIASDSSGVSSGWQTLGTYTIQ